MSFIGDQELVGKVISLVGLFLAPCTTLLSRHYSRSLYFAQILYALSSAITLTGTNTVISSYLSWSHLDFLPEYATKISGFCVTGEFACTNAKLVSAGLSWLIGVVFFFILVKLVACKKRDAKFLSFYNFYKGFMYWFFGPLIVAATTTLVPLIQAGTLSTSSKDFSGSAIVLIGFLLIGIIELIAYKCAQREEENIWRKWIEFFQHLGVGGTFASIGVYNTSTNSQDTLKYVISFVIYGLFALIYLWKYKFAAKVLERLVQIVQDGLIIATMAIFMFKSEYINSHHVDFYALAVVIVLELLVTLIKFCLFCRNKEDDDEDGDAVSP